MLSSMGALVRRGMRRGAHEAQVRRLQWDIDRHKTAIGKAVYPLFETGSLRIDLPEVDEALARIRELHERLRQVQGRRHSEASNDDE